MSLSKHHQSRLLSHFLLLSYLMVLLVSVDSVAFGTAYTTSLGALFFITMAFLCYGALYLLPAIVLTRLTFSLSNWKRQPEQAARTLPSSLVAILTTGITLLLLFANAKVFALYGMFINGFIINLVMTPGGLLSLGGSGASDAGFALIAAGFFVLQGGLFWLTRRCYLRTLQHEWLPARMYVYTLLVLVLTTFGIHFTYAANDAFGRNAIMSLTDTIPFFQHVTSRHFFAKLGYEIKRGPKLDVKGRLNYPMAPLQITAPAKPYNIVWLTSESWRADMLNPEIMPATWQFASQAARFTHNYSGGNGTRMGVFSMFTGIPGNYWFPFLKEQRGAAIIDVLQQQNYQMSLYTSAMFSYPEFEKTIFSQVPADKLHSLQKNGKQGWENDRTNVTDMLNFIDKRDPSKPFFTFMFFETPHARYYFPPESVIRRPYENDINYATLDNATLKKNITGIKNRYINAVHDLDSQFARVFDYLKEHQLLDNTIVVLVGDHGEEFMEHGYWGHNSTFVDQQIRTPLVLWVPGQAAQVSDKMTSHMDIIPTLMPLLGVSNPVSDYAIGYNLFGDQKRPYAYVSDWSKITYIDQDVKITQPVSIDGYAGNRITTADDRPIPIEQVARIAQQKQPATLQLMRDLSRYMVKEHPQPQ
ncbi:sulfatase-like hydrolase/transferase [Methylovorus mays]|uniref:sulfatase-like hydrolase/transferase n=1 Tax=Methylovorus mays TaxID=184077 RepID=UPI001E358A9A|nr:sulfatase-like hydrolase/transferase [Methylovorus mays]MCB5206936.1 sulfatase-like hydrolase/transferase [Methylovorus mays]